MTTDYGYVLPTVIDPTEFICVQVNIPNDQFHLAAFMGQLHELTRWYNWAKDDAHTAIQVAAVWSRIYEEVRASVCEGSMFDIRQQLDRPCVIQKTSDGETWVDAVNLQLCPPQIRINNGIIEWLDGDGNWQPVDGGDERNDGSSPPPYPGGVVPSGQDARCLAAENITAIWQTGLTQLRAGVVLGQASVAIAATITGIMGIFIAPALVSTLALVITGLALDAGEAGLDAMLDPAHLDGFKCAIYCNVEADGSFTAADFTAARAAIADYATGLELTITQTWLDGFGSVGLTRQGAAGGVTTGDCVDCDCDRGNCALYVFTGSWLGWSIDFDGTHSPRSSLWEDYGQGAVMSSTGIKSIPHSTPSGNVAGMGIYRLIDPLTVVAPNGIETELKIRRENDSGGTHPSIDYLVQVRYSGSSWHSFAGTVNYGYGSTGTLHLPNAWGAGTILNEFVVLLASNAYEDDTIYLESVEIICAS